MLESALSFIFSFLERGGLWILFLGALSLGFYLFISFLRKKESNIILNKNFLEIVPSLFPSFGILCTFAGVAYGLSEFDINDIDKSIPRLIDGLKTAFYASGLGIILLITYNIVISRYLAKKEINESTEKLNEQKFEELSKNIVSLQSEIASLKRDIINAIKGENENGLSAEFVKTRDLIKELKDSIGSSKETSLLYQIQKLRDEQDSHQKEVKNVFNQFNKELSGINTNLNTLNNINQSIGNLNENVNSIKSVQEENSKSVIEKMNEFSKQLSESNTKALVEAMEKVINDFNSQMKELIGRLVKENFEELNNSVKNLNDWQKENKSQIEALIKQFELVREGITETTENVKQLTELTNQIAENNQKITDSSKEIVEYTGEMVGNNSKLNDIIQELRKVMVEDKKFTEITNGLYSASGNIQQVTQKFNQLFDNNNTLIQAMNELVIKLNQIEKLKDMNSEYWKDIKSKLEESIKILEGGNTLIRQSINKLDDAFYTRLDNTFKNLDGMMRSVGEKYLSQNGQNIKK